jgi:hypothetical protein
MEPNIYRPSIHRKKDGLLLVTCTGQGRFLTWFESIQFWLGLTDAEKLERKFCRRADPDTYDARLR